MTIEKCTQDGAVVLKLAGWLDTETAPMLEKELSALEEGVTSLVIDCSGLEFISSAGLRQIVAAHKKMNGDMTLRNVSGEIMNIIKMTGLAGRLRFDEAEQG